MYTLAIAAIKYFYQIFTSVGKKSKRTCGCEGAGIYDGTIVIPSLKHGKWRCKIDTR